MLRQPPPPPVHAVMQTFLHAPHRASMGQHGPAWASPHFPCTAAASLTRTFACSGTSWLHRPPCLSLVLRSKHNPALEPTRLAATQLPPTTPPSSTDEATLPSLSHPTQYHTSLLPLIPSSKSPHSRPPDPPRPKHLPHNFQPKCSSQVLTNSPSHKLLQCKTQVVITGVVQGPR